MCFNLVSNMYLLLSFKRPRVLFCVAAALIFECGKIPEKTMPPYNHKYEHVGKRRPMPFIGAELQQNTPSDSPSETENTAVDIATCAVR